MGLGGGTVRLRWAEWKLGGRDERGCMSDAEVSIGDGVRTN